KSGSGYAVLLLDGRVLVQDDTPPNPGSDSPDVYGAELYDPSSGTWTATAYPAGFGNPDSVLVLRDGRVLMMAGDSPRLYDPGSGTWTTTGKMVAPGYARGATLLPDGRVLAVGGFHLDKNLKSAELYDPQTNSWTATADEPAASWGNATLLQDGTVLVLEG